MAILLPELPRTSSVQPRLVRYGGDLRSPLGGPIQRVTRLGSRFAVDVTMPPMEKACAARLVAARLQAEAVGDVLRLPVPQNGDGASVGGVIASGGAVNTASLTKNGGAGIAVGMFFSFVAGGVNYLHMVTSVAGNTLGVAPLLRASPAGLPLNFAAPIIEGLADETAWSVDMMRVIGQSFVLEEAR